MEKVVHSLTRTTSQQFFAVVIYWDQHLIQCVTVCRLVSTVVRFDFQCIRSVRNVCHCWRLNVRWVVELITTLRDIWLILARTVFIRTTANKTFEIHSHIKMLLTDYMEVYNSGMPSLVVMLSGLFERINFCLNTVLPREIKNLNQTVKKCFIYNTKSEWKFI